MSAKVLVLSGDGMNCERESARAFEEAGGETTILHVNELLLNPKQLLQYSIFCVPGGFSFGDELRSGKILAEKMRKHLPDIFEAFTQKGGLTIGVCNGFQVLIQLGAFTGLHSDRAITLSTNDHGTFLDRWIELEVTKDATNSPWFEGITENILLPIRHKEGKIVIKKDTNPNSFRFPLRYVEAVNGSYNQSAALLDPTGQILGLMPHPEAATHGFLNSFPHPKISPEQNATNVRKLFKNAVERARS